MPLQLHAYLRALLVFAVILAVGAERAVAGGLQDPLGPLAQVVKLGDDTPWRAGLRGPWFTLANNGDETAVRSYRVRAEGPLRGDGVFRARITLASDTGAPPALAGLFMAHRTGGGFSGLGVAADGQVSLLTGHADDRLELTHLDAARARVDGNDVIEIREAGASVVFALNGAEVFRLGPGQTT